MGFPVAEYLRGFSVPGESPFLGPISRPGVPPAKRRGLKRKAEGGAGAAVRRARPAPSSLRRLEIASPSTVGAVIDHLRREPVLVALAPVYALLAAPTAAGIAGLNRLKRRLPGKNYGTAAGNISKFWDLVEESSVPAGFAGPADLEDSRDIFFRCKVAGARVDTPALRAGTHQTLILDGGYRDLMCEVEQAFQHEADPGLFGGHRFSAPLITSCNLSGDPLGSITDSVRARAFAKERGVGLWVDGAGPSDESGSYPILELEASGVSIRREGGSIRDREIYRRFGNES